MEKNIHPSDSTFEGKIVSLIASTTEIVCALGCKEFLVGISHECDFPESILDLPRCSAPRIDVDISSIEIENTITGLIKNALSIYSVDQEKLIELSPDIILTQDMCRVCAVSEDDVKMALRKSFTKSVQMYSFSPMTLHGIFDGILEIGNLLNKSETARNLVVDMKIRIKAIKEESKRIKRIPKVCAIEWIDPIYTGGNWMPELIEIAGGQSVFGKTGEHSKIIQFSEIVDQDPDILLILPCGWDISRSESELHPLLHQPEWSYLKAVRNGKVFILDGNQYFNRPGPRIIDSIEILTEIFHPWKFIHEFEGSGWVKYE